MNGTKEQVKPTKGVGHELQNRW